MGFVFKLVIIMVVFWNIGVNRGIRFVIKIKGARSARVVKSRWGLTSFKMFMWFYSG